MTNQMKILTSEQIRIIDAESIKREGIPSLELMKRAATAFYDRFTDSFPDRNISVLLYCGVGNNGGDGLAVARMLHKSGYKVMIYVVEYSPSYSEDCAHNLRRVKAENVPCRKISSDNDLPDPGRHDVVIDAIFGTGLTREVTGIAKQVIDSINACGKPVFSIDMPSGMHADRKTSFAVKATETITFQIPKLALFLPENSAFTGHVSIVPIGLNEDAIAEAESNLYFTADEAIRALLKPLGRFTHKGAEGHALIIGGNLGKIGSVCLASKAALKTGCGLVTAYLPKCGMPVVQSFFPEAMAIEDHHPEHITHIEYDLHPDAIGIGTGMGLLPETVDAMHRFLQNNRSPLVIDADGLNILAQHNDWIALLPPETILTPHPKELSRLIGGWRDDYEKIQKTRLFAREHALIVVVKGAYSLIVDADNIYMNSTGTPALATAGSGDVLTGMITSLLAQGYKPTEAARVGVYLHGLTADLTEETIHPRSFTASDIIDNIGNAYLHLEKKR